MTPPFVLRPMRLEDVPQVAAIDHASSTLPWSVATYEFEIANRDTSHLVVLEQPGENAPARGGLRGLLQRWFGAPAPGVVVGYGGCWIIAGEAHVSIIAVHPDFRGRGLGELLLASMLQRAVRLDGEYSVLEVRESNVVAQTLYAKYEYQAVDRRRGYYRDNDEDALLMEVRPLDAAYRTRLNARIAALAQRVAFIDHFTDPNHSGRRNVR